MTHVLEDIYKAGLKLLEPLTPKETYATVVREAVKLVDAEYGSILLAQKGKLARVYVSSPVSFPVKRRHFAEQVFKSRQVAIVDVSKSSKLFPLAHIKKSAVQTIIYVPLSYRNKSIGALIVTSCRKLQNSATELKVLKLFGSMASLAITKSQLYDQTKTALETRDLFISMAAHEFRTPLTTISGYVQLLQTKLPEISQHVQVGRWVKELSWEALRLTNMVNELLEVSRINTGKIQYTWREHSLKEIIGRAILDFQFTHPDHKIVFQCNLGVGQDMVVGDFDKLLQVIINLLDNSAKFSQLGSEIIVRLRLKSPTLVLTVKDQGRGIDKKDLPRIFEGFYKGASNTVEGMGIGLFLSKNIVEEHRGSIKVRSQVDKGTIVEIQLPRAKISTSQKSLFDHVAETADRVQ
ncbi:GAF domain-containing sensor histidine kinase [Candidatus Daviesbacteria bacterium]|nr:GAF domain-containing sensor histidine kinase [Candidatus Daviesbacteria bacterium]